jgi:hypothetical protein
MATPFATDRLELSYTASAPPPHMSPPPQAGSTPVAEFERKLAPPPITAVDLCLYSARV